MDSEKEHEEQEEIRNELLVEIHNRLAEISKFLEVGIVLFAKLDTYHSEQLKDQCGKIHGMFSKYSRIYDMLHDEDCNIGFSPSKRLYGEFWEDLYKYKDDPKQFQYPLGEDKKRIHPINEEEGYFLTNTEIEARKKQEAE